MDYLKKKSGIRETKHLSTDADSSTDAIGGWTKNTPKLIFFEKRKKSSKTQKHLELDRVAPLMTDPPPPAPGMKYVVVPFSV